MECVECIESVECIECVERMERMHACMHAYPTPGLRFAIRIAEERDAGAPLSRVSAPRRENVIAAIAIARGYWDL